MELHNEAPVLVVQLTDSCPPKLVPWVTADRVSEPSCIVVSSVPSHWEMQNMDQFKSVKGDCLQASTALEKQDIKHMLQATDLCKVLHL